MTNDFRKLAKKIERTTIDIKNNATKVVDTLEEVISNDATKKNEISLSLRLKLQRQDVTITKRKNSSICNNY